MGFFGAMGKALKAPLKPINKAVGNVPGINKIQQATPGLKQVGQPLGIGPSPNVPQQMAPPAPQGPPDMGQGEPMTQAPPMDQGGSPEQAIQNQANEGPVMGQNKLAMDQARQNQMQQFGQSMGNAFGNQGMMRPQVMPRMNPQMGGQGIGPNPQMMQRMMQQRQSMMRPRQPMMGRGGMNRNPAPMM